MFESRGKRPIAAREHGARIRGTYYNWERQNVELTKELRQSISRTQRTLLR